MLEFYEGESAADPALSPIEVLEVVAGMIALILGQEEKRVLRSELLFDSGVPFDAVEFVVGADAVVMLVVEIEGPAHVADDAELRGEFAILAVATIRTVGAQPDAVPLEQAG